MDLDQRQPLPDEEYAQRRSAERPAGICGRFDGPGAQSPLLSPYGASAVILLPLWAEDWVPAESVELAHSDREPGAQVPELRMGYMTKIVLPLRSRRVCTPEEIAAGDSTRPRKAPAESEGAPERSGAV